MKKEFNYYKTELAYLGKLKNETFSIIVSNGFNETRNLNLNDESIDALIEWLKDHKQQINNKKD